MDNVIFKNMMLFKPDVIGKYDIPIIKPLNEDILFEEAVCVNYYNTVKHKENKLLHFYIDDYAFERFWINPTRYLDKISSFKYVLSPDFSLYTDMPKALSIYNHYRKHYLGAYWQSCGVKVIPTISWGDEDSYEYCFDGEPVNSILSVSTLGSIKIKEYRKKFIEGFNEMIKRLNPHTIILCGHLPSGIIYNGKIIPFKNFQLKNKVDIRNERSFTEL